MRCLDWSPDFPHLFASGGQDHYVRIWDVRFPHSCLMAFSVPYNDLVVRIRWEGESILVSGDSNILGCIHAGVSDCSLVSCCVGKPCKDYEEAFAIVVQFPFHAYLLCHSDRA